MATPLGEPLGEIPPEVPDAVMSEEHLMSEEHIMSNVPYTISRLRRSGSRGPMRSAPAETNGTEPRIEPVSPPYEPEVEAQLTAMMPPGVPPILLYRTFVRNPTMTEAMDGWGRYELSRRLTLSMREREIAIDRTCARCGCEYEWGVHVAYFAERVGLDAAQIASITHGTADDACWTDERERVLIAVVDSLHDGADLDDQLYARARRVFAEAELLDLFMLCGWYHAISYAANAARIELEDGAPRFADHRPTP